MLEQLSKMTSSEIGFIVIAMLFMVLIMAVSIYALITMGARKVVYTGIHDSNCRNCKGSGKIYEGDEHLECDCPCDMELR